jgi:hypothetical protein
MGSWTEIVAVGADAVEYTDGGLNANTAYAYRIRACNDHGCSAYSGEAQATTTDFAPQAPTGLSALSSGPASVELSWQDQSSNEVQFEIDRRLGPGGPWGQIGAVGSNATGFVDTGLNPGTTYTYRVRACNSGGCSANSNEASATTESVSGPNLSIGALYITQSAQGLDGGVTLVQGKAGYLRVFALASQTNNWQPAVRIRFYRGGILAHTEVIDAPGSSVPVGVDESSLGSSWNMLVPGSLIQPGTAILAEVDPDNQVAESVETDNVYPADGSPQAMSVLSSPTFNVTFVPVRQSVNNRLGDVSPGSAGGFLDVTLTMLPVAVASADVHSVYVTNAPVLQSDDGNNAWGTILSEMSALRVAEGSSRYYYGVVRTTYSSGVAGMGYQGWPAAVGWDFLPSGSSIAAHEWGHNWSLSHAPGCGAADPDGAYPYGDGKIGIWGMDVGSGTLKSPDTYYDFMSYCGPEWVSDYHYQSVVLYRQASGALRVGRREEPSLLIWGRIGGEGVVLEPAFQVTTRPLLPSGSGDYRLEGWSADGEHLFSFPFEPIPVPDAGAGEGHFAFAIPLGSFPASRLSRIEVSGRGGSLASRHRSQGPESGGEPAPELLLRPDTEGELTWDGAQYPMALVRDPRTREVLAFVRGGRLNLPVPPGGLQVILSDGVRSREAIRISPR